MKKIVAWILTVAIISINSICLAYEFPNSFWSVNSKYENALKYDNYNDIIKYGNQIIDIMKNAPEGSEKRGTIVTRYKEIGLAYAALGKYDKSADAFQNLYDYASRYESEFYGYLKSAEARVDQYKSIILLYTDNGKSSYYGAKNEKKNGVLFGMCANGGTRSELENESMVLTYQELGQSLLPYNTGVVRNADAEGVAVEFALNCPNEGDDIENIKSMTSYLKEISDMFKEYPDVPIYLRFAAEFDIWTDLTDAESFKTAFRYVSNYFKSRNSNVAMVWSPNQVSNFNIDIDDYYPGDEYVDWVGISLYSQRYFLGDKTQPEENEIIFKTGKNSDPVIAIRDIVETYGDRKPIMISESGAGHKLVKSGENTSDFALQRLKEHYSYLPMVYPQIKAIAYFDHFVESNGEKNDFRLSTNKTLQKEYLKLTKGVRFVQDQYDNNVDFCYRKVENGIGLDSIFQLSCYAHKYNNSVETVVYFIDDDYVGMSDEIPYSTYVDASDYSGRHTLKAIVAFADGQTMTTQYEININNSNENITVEISGDKVDFDQEPILYNDRTMVPMRKIFEELGAKVSWNNETKTATGKKGDRTVKITLGQNKMYVNSKEVILDTAPIEMSGRTLVPVRAVAEGLGCEVDWSGKYNLVSITPKVFKWSEWEDDLPSYVNNDLYYIEEKKLYSYRKKEYYNTDYEKSSLKYLVNVDKDYGSWSSWQSDYISSSDKLEVETRTQSSPQRYKYAHWCTGNLADSSNRYKTANYNFHDECSYHELGWFDNPLPPSEDSSTNYTYYVDGAKYRCSNSCYRWYLVDTEGGDYKEYRYRNIYYTYTYWQWSNWSTWDAADPYDYYKRNEIEVEKKTVYRYKEK